MTERQDIGLRILSVLVLALGALTALAGLFWEPGGTLDGPELYGRGLYRRDTVFVAGGSQGSDVLSLLLVLPAGLWAVFGRPGILRRPVLIGVHTWWLYLSVSLAFGAIAINEAFPLYVTLMPLSLWALILSLQNLRLQAPPRGLPAFLIGAGVVTGLAWGLLLWSGLPPEKWSSLK